MFILVDNSTEGVYAVKAKDKSKIVQIFEKEDDAERYAMMLEEDDDYPEMHVLEVESEVMIKTCKVHGYNFTVITPNDIVIPPKIEHDFF